MLYSSLLLSRLPLTHPISRRVVRAVCTVWLLLTFCLLCGVCNDSAKCMGSRVSVPKVLIEQRTGTKLYASPKNPRKTLASAALQKLIEKLEISCKAPFKRVLDSHNTAPLDKVKEIWTQKFKFTSPGFAFIQNTPSEWLIRQKVFLKGTSQPTETSGHGPVNFNCAYGKGVLKVLNKLDRICNCSEESDASNLKAHLTKLLLDLPLTESEAFSESLINENHQIIAAPYSSALSVAQVRVAMAYAMSIGKPILYIVPQSYLMEGKCKQLKQYFAVATSTAHIFVMDLKSMKKLVYSKALSGFLVPTERGQRTPLNHHSKKTALVIFDEMHHFFDSKVCNDWEECLLACPQDISLLILTKLIPNSYALLNWIKSIYGDTDFFFDRNIPASKYYYSMSKTTFSLFERASIERNHSSTIEDYLSPPIHLTPTEKQMRNEHFEWLPLNSKISELRRNALKSLFSNSNNIWKQFRSDYKNRQKIRRLKKFGMGTLDHWLSYWVNFQLKRSGENIISHMNRTKLEALEIPSLTHVLSSEKDSPYLIYDADSSRCDRIAEELVNSTHFSNDCDESTILNALNSADCGAYLPFLNSSRFSWLVKGVATYYSDTPNDLKEMLHCLISKNLIKVVVTDTLFEMSFVNTSMTCVLPRLQNCEFSDANSFWNISLPHVLTLASLFKKVIFLHSRYTEPHEIAAALLSPTYFYNSHYQLSFGNILRNILVEGGEEANQLLIGRTYLWFLRLLRDKHNKNLKYVDPYRTRKRIEHLSLTLDAINVTRQELQDYHALLQKLKRKQDHLSQLKKDMDKQRINVVNALFSKVCTAGMVAVLRNGEVALILGSSSTLLEKNHNAKLENGDAQSSDPSQTLSKFSPSLLVLTENLKLYIVGQNCLVNVKKTSDSFATFAKNLYLEIIQSANDTKICVGRAKTPENTLVRNITTLTFTRQHERFCILALYQMTATKEHFNYALQPLPRTLFLSLESTKKFVETPWNKSRQQLEPTFIMNQNSHVQRIEKALKFSKVHQRDDFSRLISHQEELQRLRKQIKRGGRDSRQRQLRYLSRLYGNVTVGAELNGLIRVLHEWGALHNSYLTSLGKLCASLDCSNELWLAIILITDTLHADAYPEDFASLIYATTCVADAKVTSFWKLEEMDEFLNRAKRIADRLQLSFCRNHLTLPIPLNINGYYTVRKWMTNKSGLHSLNLSEVENISYVMDFTSKKLKQILTVAMKFVNLIAPNVNSLANDALKIINNCKIICNSKQNQENNDFWLFSQDNWATIPTDFSCISAHSNTATATNSTYTADFFHCNDEIWVKQRIKKLLIKI